MSQQGHSLLAKSIPALRLYSRDRIITMNKAVAKTKRKDGRKREWSRPNKGMVDASMFGGVYYGISPRTYEQASQPGQKRLSLSDSMAEALDELRTLRQEIETIRKEMQSLKRKMIADDGFEEDVTDDPGKVALARRKRQREFEKISVEVERWARKILFDEGEEDGWTELECNKMMEASLNKTGRTKAFIKWMKDSRGDNANLNDENEHPCIKVYTTIDAPLNDVCAYLSQSSAVPEYNDLVVKFKDVEEIMPHAKIVWGQTPQILFIKPRDFITFCSHRWTRDGTQVIINQATEHADWPTSQQDSNGKSCRAYALRGANCRYPRLITIFFGFTTFSPFFVKLGAVLLFILSVISSCPDDPDKTRILIVAHANPGQVAPWAVKTAVNALAPIEPFKLFHKINENVLRSQPKLRELTSQAEMVSSLPGRSPYPAGLAQLGYACFWPKGGGVMEGASIDEKSSEEDPEKSENIDSNADGGV